MTSLVPLARPFTVVVAVDFSPSSDRALATARTLCALSGSGRLALTSTRADAQMLHVDATPAHTSPYAWRLELSG